MRKRGWSGAPTATESLTRQAFAFCGASEVLDKKKAMPEGIAKFREETSKKQTARLVVALLRCTT